MFNYKQLPLAAALLALHSLGHAAAPDAGSVLREEIQRDQPARPIMPPKIEVAPTAEPEADTGPKVTVATFNISGLSAISDAEAQAFLAPWVGKPLTANGLNKVADAFEKWLRSRGLFLARAYLPPQDVKSGKVEIRVLEGRVEGIDIKRAPDTRLPEETLRNIVAGALPPGAPLDQERLERGLLLANDLPGTSARAVLSPGKDLGTSRVLVEAAEGPELNGSGELDNTGNRYTGWLRATGTVNLNDPSGHGEQWSLRATKSQGSMFMRAALSLPLGSSGLKGGVNYINSQYSLCCDRTISSLKLDGSSEAYTGQLSYPLLRTRLTNLSLSASLSHRNFANRAFSTTTSDKSTDTLTLGANGDWNEQTGLGAYSTYGVQFVTGNLDLDRWQADKTQDRLTAQTQGEYRKITGQFTYLRRMSDKSALYAAISGQWANKNLDSSEKFSLGGPTGVRAYPTGEASADQGLMVNVEWRQELMSKLRMSLFADYGQVVLHTNTWSFWNIGTNAPNRYSLSGVGASLIYNPTPLAQITATLASRVGTNPARDANGRDSDGTRDLVRLWLQGSLAF